MGVSRFLGFSEHYAGRVCDNTWSGLQCWRIVTAEAYLTRRSRMTVDRYLRLIAGFFVLLSVGLSLYHPYFLYFTAFVGLNLLQSAITGWCPMMGILRAMGVPDRPKGK